MIRASVALAASLLAGCEGGPVAERFDRSATRLHVVATFVDSVDAYVDIHAWLVPGVAEDGRVREVLDPVLGVAGREIEPTGRGGQPGELVYRARWAVDSEDLAEIPLTFEPPDVEGVTPSYGPVRWFTFGRGGPYSTSWSGNDDLVLELDPPAESSIPFPGPIHADLSLRGAGESQTDLRAPFPPANPVVVPRELVPSSGSSIRAILSLGQYRPEVPPGEAYQIAVSLSARLLWEIRIVEARS